MFSNFKRISTSGLNNYARLLNDNPENRAENVSFPCGAKLIGGISLRALFASNTREVPSTIMQCGDMLWGGQSAVCLNCYAEYDHQENGDVESIPMRGSTEDEEALVEIDASVNESRLVRFAKNHPFLTAGIGVLFATGTIGAAIGAYKASSQSATQSASTQLASTTTEQPEVAQTSTIAQLATTVQLSSTDHSTIAPSTTTKLTTTSQATTDQPPTTSQPATLPSSTFPSSTLSTSTIQATTTEPVPAKRSGVNKVIVNVHNLRSRAVDARFETCNPNCTLVKRNTILNNGEETIVFDLNEGVTHVNARYSFASEEGQPLKSALSDQVLPEGRIELARNETIDSLDKNADGALEVRHTLLNFEGSNRLDQVFEDENGMPKYAGVTTEKMKLVLDNRWKTRAKFEVSGKGASGTRTFGTLSVWWFKDLILPAGMHKVDINLKGYPVRSYTAQALNKAVSHEGTIDTVCVTAGYNSPTYLSDIKHGRCGR